MTSPATPAELRTSVLAAVHDGAWSAVDVAATVIAEIRAERAVVLAMLWDLVEDGTLVYDGTPPRPGFRAAALRLG
jgi:hypothetical protein